MRGVGGPALTLERAGQRTVGILYLGLHLESRTNSLPSPPPTMPPLMWFPPSQELPQFLHSLLNVLNSPTECRRGEQSRGWAVGWVTGRWLTPGSTQATCPVCGLWQTPTSQPERPSLGPTASPAHSSSEHQLPARIMGAAK